ncbi:hypothetical protein LK12_18285 [Novosphingobium malaysiense]|uniref:HTH tetR-type domain-containing protein n=2 Tax=Novosphingobium malaysiense TaxID=1348853 RepID=A0A0B1ZL01_9SPHN|nr:hypothetical protein LK12_18285 [Novosphingobium malaysiense]
MSMATRQRRSHAERKAESELALLNAAINVIAEAGVGAVTFEALGRTSGLSRGLATVRFGSKSGLIEAVLHHLHERQEALIRQHHFDDMRGIDAVLGYVELCLRDMGHRNEAKAYFMLLSSAVAEGSDLRASFAKTHSVVKTHLQRWVERGLEDGSVGSSIDPHDAGLMIGSLMFGISMQLLVDPSTEIEPLREASIAMLRKSLAA